MFYYRKLSVGLFCFVLMTVIGFSVTAHAQTPATWTGAGGDSSYNNAANWDVGIVPIDGGGTTYKIIIPSGKVVEFDVPGAGLEVTQLTLASGGTLTMGSGRTLSVLDKADIAGNLSTTNGTLLANHLSSVLTGNKAVVNVNSAGGRMDLAAVNYDVRGINSGTILSATGSGAQLNLGTLNRINNYSDFNYGTVRVRTISATGGGAIDLSGLQYLHGGKGSDRLDIITETGGTIDLSALEQIVEGNVKFITDATALTFASLQHASAMTFDVPDTTTLSFPELLTQNGGSYVVPTAGGIVSAPKLHTLTNASVSFEGTGTFNAGLLTDFGGSTLTLSDTPANQSFNSGMIVNIDNAKLLLSNGATFNKVSDPVYTATGIKEGTILSATDSGTLLDLSAVNEINVYQDFDYGTVRVRTISATDSGQIDLSGLTTLHGGKGSDRLDIITQAGGTIDLSALQTIDGNVKFVTDAPILSLPKLLTQDHGIYVLSASGETIEASKLHTLTNASVSFEGTGTFNAGLLTDFGGSTLTLSDTPANQSFNSGMIVNIDNAKLLLSNGATFNKVSDPVYTATGIKEGAILSATDSGTLLDLSSVNEISVYNDFDYGTVRVRTISATNDGQIDLSGMTKLHGGKSSDRLDIIAETGGTIDLSGLQEVIQGNVKFITDQVLFSLPALQHASAVTYSLPANGTLSLPEQLTQNGGGFTLPDGGTVNAPKLSDLTNATVSFAGAGSFNAGLLANFSGSTLTLSDSSATQSFNSGLLTNINNAKFILSNSAEFGNVAASIYDSRSINSGTILSATGVDTLLDLSSVDEINVYQDFNYGTVRVRTISATDSGAIDLSGVTKIHGGKSSDRLDIVTNTGGTVDLSGLERIIEGNVKFVTDATSLTLASLQHASAVTYNVPDATTISLPEQLTQNGGGFVVSDGGAVNAPKLETLNNASVSFVGIGAFNASSLTDFSGSKLTLSDTPANQTFQSGTLTNINNAKFLLSNGAEFGNVSDTIYDVRGVNNEAVLKATGAGSALHLSGIDEINAYADFDYGSVRARTITATNLGQIDLTGLTKLHGGKGSDRLDIIAQTGGVVDMSNLQTIIEGNVKFVVNSGGEMLLGDFAITTGMNMQVDGSTTSVTARSLTLASNVQFSLTAGAKMKLYEGDYMFAMSDESAVNADSGIMNFTGAYQWMEVGGTDNGVDGQATNNFGMAQLIVGTDATATTLLLVDVIDNGNRATPEDNEALYLLGSGGLDGLQLLSGSILRIGDIPVYTLIDGEMTMLQDMFAPGETSIAFTEFGSDGFIELIDPSELLGDVNRDGLINGFDVDPFVNVLLNGPYRIAADMNEDGFVNGFDVDPFVNAVLGNGPVPLGTDIPEPATLLLLGVGVAGLIRRRASVLS